MKTLLYNIYPDIYTTDIFYDDAYDVYVNEFINYFKEHGSTCTVRIDIGGYRFKDISSCRFSYIEPIDNCVHVAISGEHIEEMEEQIHNLILKAPVFICNIFVAEDEDILTPTLLCELNQLSCDFTTIEIKDLPQKRIFRVNQAAITDKDSVCFKSESPS